MGQPTERDSAPEPNTLEPDAAPAPDTTTDDDVPYVPPVKAYERPPVGYRPATSTISRSEPTQSLPVVVGTVAVPAPPAVSASGPAVPADEGAPPEPAPSTPSAVPPPEAAVEAPAAPSASDAGPPSVSRSSALFPLNPQTAVPSAASAEPETSAGAPGVLGGLVGDGQPSRAPRALLWTGIGVVVLAGLYAGAQWVYADKVPTGTHVAGVDLGGLSHDEAVDQLDAALVTRAKEPVQITAGDAQTTVDPAAAGLALDAEATVSRITGFSLSPLRLWAHLTGGDDASPVVTVDKGKLDEAVAGLVDALATEPVDGTVAFSDGQAVATPAQAGTRVDPQVAAATLRTRWLMDPGPYDLPTEAVAPEITQEETDAALAQAQKIVSAPVVVAVGDQHPELPVDALASVASFTPQDGALQPAFDGEKLVAAVVARTTHLLTEPDDAHFEFQGGRPVVVGGAPGTTLDPATLATAVQTAALGDDRTAPVDLVQRDPQQSREALEKLGVTEVVSSFSTPLTSEPIRTQNLRRGAELLTGHLIEPGETFSLLNALSPITVANGYKSAGVISNGVHTEGVGGGLSQMATTTYNAGYFAGFEDVEHRPHSVSFTRYPAGREATIAVGSLDMRFKNNSPYGAVMQAWVDGGQLHVQIWSTKYFQVETSASGKTNVVSRRWCTSRVRTAPPTLAASRASPSPTSARSPTTVPSSSTRSSRGPTSLTTPSCATRGARHRRPARTRGRTDARPHRARVVRARRPRGPGRRLVGPGRPRRRSTGRRRAAGARRAPRPRHRGGHARHGRQHHGPGSRRAPGPPRAAGTRAGGGAARGRPLAHDHRGRRGAHAVGLGGSPGGDRGAVVIDEAGLRDCRDVLRTLGVSPRLVPARTPIEERAAIAGPDGSLVVERPRVPAGFVELAGSERLGALPQVWYGLLESRDIWPRFAGPAQVWLAFGPYDDHRGSLQPTLAVIADAGVDLQHLRSHPSTLGPHVFFTSFLCPRDEVLDTLAADLDARGIAHRTLAVLPGHGFVPGPDALAPRWAGA
ncbi:VanW family protein [Xylanimonas allomyrinae]|uniref:VanW family protein n=1 Tax=Xylanimonas allomyrinae TaxID=2509459 RepID=UPI001FE58515|nr:VanW family protein [Xylanimonas allomyrinae]